MICRWNRLSETAPLFGVVLLLWTCNLYDVYGISLLACLVTEIFEIFLLYLFEGLGYIKEDVSRHLVLVQVTGCVLHKYLQTGWRGFLYIIEFFLLMFAQWFCLALIEGERETQHCIRNVGQSLYCWICRRIQKPSIVWIIWSVLGLNEYVLPSNVSCWESNFSTWSETFTVVLLTSWLCFH